MKEIKFEGKFYIKADIVLITGLHIGTEENTMEIGGIDNPVIKDAFGKPYIPGSSLKGKLRSLMEYYHEKINANELVITKGGKNQIRMHMCDDEDCPVCNLFGRNHGEHKFVNNIKKDFENLMPTRLIVRDAMLDETSITNEMLQYLDTNYTEVKPENSLDRITSFANPRFNERVPAGTKFKVEFVINTFNDDNTKYLKELFVALKLLEDDYLGGAGSRGYGKIKFENLKVVYRDKKFYLGESGEKILLSLENLTEKINWEEIENKLIENGD
ncbi:MAG: type III-A CRISPR-associated RAMP protein Csm3 [Thermosipho sp. (in: Bacteria)]|nr:type III-A CRISPR-associated RAMP protein Csm3 [Thermosipho sp. (in: thermotogales)]